MAELRVIDLGRMAYIPAWDEQRRIHDLLLEDPSTPETVLLVEHDPVITISQRKSAMDHLVTPRQQLTAMGIDVQETDRGGDVTYHGPGQLVAYPIIRLATHGLNVGRYMKLLENAVIRTLATFGITGYLDPSAIGVWVDQPVGPAAKICAMGVRVRRNVTLHGLALNVTTDLSHFATIIPCGLAGRPVTSMQQMLGPSTPAMQRVKDELVRQLREALV
jgi:lipoyl(octanoyl) transferase